MRSIIDPTAPRTRQPLERPHLAVWSARREAVHAAAGLLGPCLDIGVRPDLSHAQCRDRCREVRLCRQLGDALPAEAEHLRDLGSGEHRWRLHAPEYIGNPPIDTLPIGYLPSRLVDKSSTMDPSPSANTMTTTPHAPSQARPPCATARLRPVDRGER